MDNITTMRSFHYVMSNFANLLITLKQKIGKLRTNIREDINNFKKDDNGKNQHIVTSNTETQANFKSQIYQTILDLEKQLNILENTFNDSWLRIFLYVSNYVCTIPLTNEDREEITRNVIQMHKITFPDYDDNYLRDNDKYFRKEYSDLQKKIIFSKTFQKQRKLLEEEEKEYCLN
ncbi:hypothetical protein M0804_004718 [Polistes exclamans]|nr:hypothetical protein M0804_004718 [Polistes exclamans]